MIIHKDNFSILLRFGLLEHKNYEIIINSEDLYSFFVMYIISLKTNVSINKVNLLDNPMELVN